MKLLNTVRTVCLLVLGLLTSVGYGQTFTNNTPLASCYIDLSHYNSFQTPVLSANKTYCFRAYGRGGVGPLDRGEAMADAAYYPSFRSLAAATADPSNTWEWVGHTPFRPTPDVFNLEHIYYFYFEGSNTFEKLIFQDNPYSDNVGGFNVDLFEVSQTTPVSEFVWSKLPGSTNLPTDWRSLPGSMDETRRIIYSLSENGVFWKYDIESNKFTQLPVSGAWPGASGTFIYNPADDAIWLTMYGRGQVFRLPVTGGAVTSVGSTGASYADFGSISFWDPVTRKFATFNGYGWMAVRNWRWEFGVTDSDWIQIEPNTPNKQPWPRSGGSWTVDNIGQRIFHGGGEGNSSGQQGQVDTGFDYFMGDTRFDALRDLWLLDLKSNKWVNLIPLNTAIPQFGPLAYFPPQNMLLMINGRSTKSGAFSSGLWTFTIGQDTNFTKVTAQGDIPNAADEPVNGGFSYYDNKSQQVIYFNKQGVFALAVNNQSIANPTTLRVPQDYATITAAVAAAKDGDTVSVSAGTYNEINIQIGKNITVTSLGGATNTIIDNQHNGRGFIVTGSGLTNVNIEGFTIQNAQIPRSQGGGAIKVVSGKCKISACIIQGVSGASDYGGGPVSNEGVNVDDVIMESCIVRNNFGANSAGIAGCAVNRCLIYGNTAGNNPGALWLCHATNCTVYNNTGGFLSNPWTVGGMNGGKAVNCIFWGNAGYNGQQVYMPESVTYSIIQGGFTGAGNLYLDPLFVNVPNGDFHLQAKSPAIDGGEASVTNQDPDGTRVDIGAFYYSQTNSVTPPSTVTWDFTTNPTSDPAFEMYGNNDMPWMDSTGNPGGFLALTYAIGSQNKWIIFPDIDSGKTVTAFEFSCDLRIGNPQSTRAADGFSISFARDSDPVLANRSDYTQFAGTLPEAGTTTGIAIGFDTWSGNTLPDGPDIEGIIVRVDNVTVLKYAMPTRNGNADDATSIQTGPRDAAYWTEPGFSADSTGWAHSPAAWSGLQWKPFKIVLDNEAKLTVTWKGIVILDRYQTAFFPSPGRIILAGRTGGSNENTHMDNIKLTTTAQTVDNQAPTTPGNLKALEVGSGRIALTWSPATDNSGRVAYEIEKDGIALTATIVDNNYVDRAVTAKTSHTYKVRAYDVTRNKSAYSAPVAVTTPDEVTSIGILKAEIYDNITGSTVDLLLAEPNYIANAASRVGYLYGMDTGNENGTAGFNNTWGDKYGMRIMGTLTPTETAAYDFFIRSDDSSQFYLNTMDASTPIPTTSAITVQEATCCHAFLEPSDTTEPGLTTQKPIFLTAGKSYGFLILLKDGGGGDGVAVAWRQSGDNTPSANLSAINGAVLAGKQDAVGASINFTMSPKDANVIANEKISFSALATVTSPYSTRLAYQWYKNGVIIPGATSETYSIPIATLSDNGAKITVLAIGVGAQKFSSQAILNVNIDNKRPGIVAVNTDETFSKVLVRFSEPVKSPSATTAVNYTLDNGGTVTASALVDQFTVQLTTAKMTNKTLYTLTVNNVQDNAANAIAANTKFQFQSWFLQPGRAKMEQWNGISGTGIQTLYNDPKWIGNSAADAVRYVAGMTTGGENGNATFNESWGDNYGARVSAYLIPSESGDYNFFLRSDDSSQLYLSQNENFPIPGTDSPICEETGCCSAFLEPGDATKPANTTTIPITLTAGKKYAIMAMMKEGGGGDGVSVAWRKVGDTTAASSLPDLLANIFWYGGAVATNVLTVGDTIVASSPNSPKDRDENAPNVLDGNSSTKYLNLDILNTGFTVTPKSGASVITGISLTTANDAPDRDPASFRVEGSINGTNFTVIAEGLVPADATRFFKRIYTFANTIPYTVYRVTFPTVVNAIQAMQIADVELLGNGFGGIVETPNKQPFSDGLVAYYPFNGNANDESGNGRNGTVLGATLAVDRFGNGSRAYSFDGSNGGISSADGVINIGQAEYAISFWFSMRVFDMWTDWNDGVAGLIMTHPHTGIGLGFDINRIGYLVNDLGPGNAFWSSLYRTGQKHDYTTNRWYHVVFEKQGTDYKLFVDGQVDLALNLPSASSFDYSTTLMFGGDGANFVISGSMDDVRIYNRALSAQEVSNLYSYESAVPPTNTAPKLTVATTATIPEMQPWTLQATATDADIPVQKLVFSLETAPSGMTIGATTGLIQWTPTEAQGPSTNIVMVVVTDDGQPPLKASQTFTVVVNEAHTPPVLAWTTPSDIVYGTSLSSVQLNASADMNGTFAYSPASGTILKSGSGQVLSVAFTPTDTANYSTVTKTVSVNVLKATPVLTWTTPSDIVCDTALSAAQLKASANVNGTFVYSPVSGTVLKAGLGQVLSVTFTPTDTVNYSTATKTVSVNVLKATPVLVWTAPSDITYGTALSVTQLNASASVEGTYAYIPAIGTVLKAGFGQVLSVTFTPSDTANYSTATKTANVNVLKATPVLAWATPADIAYGTALSAEQLNASASVEGTYAYIPAIGTVLKAGFGQVLSVTFTPSDTANYSTATKTVSLNVSKAPPVLSEISDRTIVAGEELVVTLEGHQVDLPTNQMTHWLVNGPTNATVSVDGQLRWTPNIAQSPSTNSFRVAVSDGSLSATNAFSVEVFDLVTFVNGMAAFNRVSSLPPVTVSIRNGKSDWLVFYSLDGTEPTASSFFYLDPFTLDESGTIWPVAFSPDFSDSVVGIPLQVNVLKTQKLTIQGGQGLVYLGQGVSVSASSDSGLPVTLEVLSGPARLENGLLIPTGGGEIKLRATQVGSDVWASASFDAVRTVSRGVQSVAWDPIVASTYGNAPVKLRAVAGSGLPVIYSVVSGPGEISNDVLTLVGAGTIVVRAAQAGNANFEPASADISVTVAKASQTLAFTALSNMPFTTVPVTLMANASSGLAAVFEVVTGPALVNGSQLTLTGVGTVVLRAGQPGSANYEAALPKDQTFTVSKGTQTLSFTDVGLKTFGDTPVTLNATSTSGLPVSFRVLSGPGILVGSQLTLTGAGSILVQVTQVGDSLYLPATATQTVVVGKAGQSIVFTSLANIGYTTNTIPLQATSSSSLPVTFRMVSGAATINGTELRLSGLGLIAVASDQPGNTNYLAAASVTNTFTVSRGVQNITFTPVGDQVLGNAPVALQAVSSAGLPVTFSVLSGPATLSGAKLTLVNEGSVTVRALNPGSPLFLSAQADQIFVIRKLTTLTVTVAGGVGGTVAVDPVKDLYAPSDTVTLTAKAATGYEFAGWRGSLSGSQNPAALTMSSSRSVTAIFKDVAAPVLVWEQPAAGETGNEYVRLSGWITDNAGVTSAQWTRDGGVTQALGIGANGAFAVENLVLSAGTNRFTVMALDATGNKTTQERTVVWTPERVLTVVEPSEQQEGKKLVIPLMLSSQGDVGGASFVLHYDAEYLKDPVFVWSSLTGASANQVNTNTAGEVRATFSMAGSSMPPGTHALATATFRARSVPLTLETPLELEIVDVTDTSGTTFNYGTDAESAYARILPRSVRGDNNANNRLDIGDATLIQRLITHLDPVRSWDVSENDLNGDGALNSGDVTKTLRVVVGLDPQPGAKGMLNTLPPETEIPLAPNHVSPIVLLSHSVHLQSQVLTPVERAFMVPNTLKGQAGDMVTVQVVLTNLVTTISGVTFVLDYPTNTLRLVNAQSHRTGAFVSANSVVVWNVAPGQNDYLAQSGRVTLAASSATPWPGTNGVLAELTFQVQAGSGSQWPLTLSHVEITPDGYDNRQLIDATALFVFDGGLPVIVAPTLTTKGLKYSSNGFGVTFEAQSGVEYVLEASTNLVFWTPIQTNSGASGPLELRDSTTGVYRYRFYRVNAK